MRHAELNLRFAPAVHTKAEELFRQPVAPQEAAASRSDAFARTWRRDASYGGHCMAGKVGSKLDGVMGGADHVGALTAGLQRTTRAATEVVGTVGSWVGAVAGTVSCPLAPLWDMSAKQWIADTQSACDMQAMRATSQVLGMVATALAEFSSSLAGFAKLGLGAVGSIVGAGVGLVHGLYSAAMHAPINVREMKDKAAKRASELVDSLDDAVQAAKPDKPCEDCASTREPEMTAASAAA